MEWDWDGMGWDGMCFQIFTRGKFFGVKVIKFNCLIIIIVYYFKTIIIPLETINFACFDCMSWV